MNDTALVETNDTNTCFMCVNPYESKALYYTYPDKKLISSFDYYDFFEEDGEINYTIVHIKDELYMTSFNGRMYLYDAPRAKVKEEIIIEGHEAKFIKVPCPTLDDEGLMTDIVMAYRFGAIIGFNTLSNKGFYVNTSDITSSIV